ncbi:MAG: hypothetical protein Q9214_000662 [Letrouitia sp. 1 TL-2023]
MPSAPSRTLAIFSGGSAANSLVDVFDEVIVQNGWSLSYIIPISDNGGSSSELIRVFGGPGIGDVRSRLVRLIPASHAPTLQLFNHRLSSSPSAASAEFFTLLDLTSPLYLPISTSQALLIRSILSHLHLEILKRTRPPTSNFNFQSASIGNLFLTGARLFSGSFESAIYLLALIGNVDESRTAVLPCIVSNFTHHISAGLEDGTVIAGQNAISHPSAPTALPQSPITPSHPINSSADHNVTENVEDATLPGSLPTLRQPNLVFSKMVEEPLPSRINRIWYINPYGQEMEPRPNPKALDAVRSSDAVIYSIGSLYTSLAPSLILPGVGDAIDSGPRFRILILNGSLDRETGGFSARDFIDAIVRACESSRGNHIPLNVEVGMEAVRRYVTHLIHLEGPGTPEVDREALKGVECMRLYGRKGDDGKMMYDQKALAQALGIILGRRDRKGERSRRNTMEGSAIKAGQYFSQTGNSS